MNPMQTKQLAAAITVALAAWPALAQSQDTSAATKPVEKNQLETVTITAERRVENIKDVPNAVSSLSGEKLEVLNSSGQDVRFLSGRVPSLNIESSFGRAFPRFYIRGYGNTDFRLNASQPVSLVYDDVVQENPILKGFPVFDLKAVEVIAGPQGTLFGRNTPAGVVKFDSVRPSQKQEGYFNASYGSYGTINADGAFNLPLGGDWSARISAQIQHRDDWVDNQNATSPTRKTEGYDDRAVRAQVLYEPNKDFSMLLNAHNRELDGSPRLFRASIIKPGTNNLMDGFDPEKASFDGINEQRLHATGGSARLKWNFGSATLNSITGIETVQPYSRGDVDAGDVYFGGASFALPPYPKMGMAFFPSQTSDALKDHRQLTQEFRLESNGSGPLRWQGGVYFFDERYTVESINYSSPANAYVDSTRTHQTNRAYAAFGNVNYKLTNDLELRGGLRYTEDKKTLSTSTADGVLDASQGLSANTKDSKWTWDLSSIYALSKDTNVYARIGTGFRGSAILPASAFGPMTIAKPEELISYEAGIKSDFWNRRARISAAVFHYDVDGLQLTEVGGSGNSNAVKSAKKATGQGIELNLDLLPIDDLIITLSGSYNDAKIKDNSLSVAGCGGGCTVTDPSAGAGQFFIGGNQLPQAPKYVGNLTARYAIPTAAGNEFFIYTDWVYRSKVNFFLYESVEFTGKSLTEGGLRLGYIWNNGKYEAAVFGRNITNQVRVTGAIDFNNLTGFINDPRTYGVQFKALF
ncbi:TonB-dependent receptor [Roseateles violae]|uniref:TonB-dependent receptor n=1 Tax=Roseateles violae TaxID=3058042 RepID=A0ABT8DKL4_9BURK|nr:TonB-dependent receptor [Pelomonas sp. PFR6]MDN3918954.1 TonB-dependent receptor [Pelomonas sp. PFR6]